MTAAVSATAIGNTPRLTFGGILASEWIKLRSVRSTVWAYSITILVSVGLSVLVALYDASAGGEDVPPEALAAGVVSIATLGLVLGQLVVAVLGVLVIGGEYSTGMIKSSLIAVPRRLLMLGGKALVLSLVTFVVGVIITFSSFAIAAPLVSSGGATASFGDEGVILALLGGALNLVFIALISLGIGTLLRSSAGGIAVALGFFLVLPIIVGIIPTDWAMEINRYLPTNASTALQAITSFEGAFEAWQAALIMIGWSVLSLGAGAIALARRDV